MGRKLEKLGKLQKLSESFLSFFSFSSPVCSFLNGSEAPPPIAF